MPHYSTDQAAQRLGVPLELVEDAIEHILATHPDHPGIDGVVFYSGGRDMSRVRITERVLHQVLALTGQAAAS